MFSKSFLLRAALVAFAPLVSALTLDTPINVTSSASITINWNNAAGDPPTFSFELVNEIFHNAFAIANNVDPSPETLTLVLPRVPAGDGYSLQAVDVGNINNVFASTPNFFIAENPETTGPQSSTTSGKTSTSGASAGSSTTSGSTTGSPSPSSQSNTNSGTSPSTSSPTSSGSSVPFNNGSSGALSNTQGVVSGAAMVLSVITGAMVLVL